MPLFDDNGFIKRKRIWKHEASEFECSELVTVVDSEKKKIPNLKTQLPSEIFYLQETSVIDGYLMTNIERLLKVNKIEKVDQYGFKYDYFERVYSYCFDLFRDNEFVDYFEIQAKSLPQARKIMKERIRGMK